MVRYELTWTSKNGHIKTEEVTNVFGHISEYYSSLDKMGATNISVRYMGQEIDYNFASDFTDRVSSLSAA
jgi:hypothetical protein